MKCKEIFSRSYNWAIFISLILDIIFFAATLYCGFRMMFYWAETSQGFWLFVGFFLAINVAQGVLAGLVKFLIDKLFPVMRLQRAREALSKSNVSYLGALWEMDRRFIKLDKYDDDFDRDKYLEKLKRSKIQKKLIEKLGNRMDKDPYTDRQLFNLLDDLDLMILKHYDILMNSKEIVMFRDPDLEIYVIEGIKKLKEEGKL